MRPWETGPNTANTTLPRRSAARRTGECEGSKPMIIEFLCQEHRNIEKLLRVLERELSVFGRGERPDYEVIRSVVAYFEVYPDAYHHPQEDLVFQKLKT